MKKLWLRVLGLSTIAALVVAACGGTGFSGDGGTGGKQDQAAGPALGKLAVRPVGGTRAWILDVDGCSEGQLRETWSSPRQYARYSTLTPFKSRLLEVCSEFDSDPVVSQR